MKTRSLYIWLIASAILLVGCEQKIPPTIMPEVTKENCQIEKIKQIADEAIRQKFAGLCSRQSVGIAPTEKPENWLEMLEPKK